MTILSLEVSRTGEAVFCEVRGQDWKLQCTKLERSHQTAIQVIHTAVQLCQEIKPHLTIMSANGVGKMIADSIMERRSELKKNLLTVVENSLPYYPLTLWPGYDYERWHPNNVRSQAYLLVRDLLSEQRLTFLKHDDELFGQMTSVLRDRDARLRDVISAKGSMKSDALALACLGYALEMQGGEKYEQASA